MQQLQSRFGIRASLGSYTWMTERAALRHSSESPFSRVSEEHTLIRNDSSIRACLVCALQLCSRHPPLFPASLSGCAVPHSP